MNGAGNDFMVVDARGLELDYEAMAIELCKLMGADGFMALDKSDTADFRLHFYNSDGSRGEMCGNGARCICRFAYDNGLAGESMVVETDAGPVYGWRLNENQYKIRMNDPTVLDLHRKPDVAYVELGNPGLPLAVKEWPGLSWEQKDALRDMARALRHDPAFPKGANVNLYTWLDAATVRNLTFERGVEDYTLACGTGSTSVAAVLWMQGKLPGGVLTVKNPGGDLIVTVTGEKGVITELLLEGPTEVVTVVEI